MKSSNFQKYNTSNPVKSFFIKDFLDTFIDMIPFENLESVLDIGCGEGFVLGHICKKYPESKLFGIDISKKAIAEAGELLPKSNLKVGDIYNVSNEFSKTKFDLVLAMEILEHLDNPLAAIEEIGKVKAKNFIFSVPNEPWFSFGNLVFGKNISRLGSDIDHVNFWNKSRFIKFVEPYFRVQEVKTPFPWIILLCRTND